MEISIATCDKSDSCVCVAAGLEERFRQYRPIGGDCVMHDEDTLLMARFASGSEEAFDELFKRNASRATQIALRFISSAEDAGDLAQEAFMRILSARQRWEPTARFTTWMYRIVANLCFKQQRKSKGVHPLSIDAPIETGDGWVLPEPAAASSSEPEAMLLAAEIARTVREALSTLPANQRRAIVLHRFEGRSYQEASEMMGCSVSAVASLLHRARQALRKRLDSWVSE